MSSLPKLLGRDALRETAGGRSFEPGKECFSDGCIRLR